MTTVEERNVQGNWHQHNSHFHPRGKSWPVADAKLYGEDVGGTEDPFGGVAGTIAMSLSGADSMSRASGRSLGQPPSPVSMNGWHPRLQLD